MTTLTDPYERNLQRHLRENAYPGRILAIGQNLSSEPVIVYALMGRSEDSRNRGFVHEGGVRDIIKTAQVKRKKMSAKTKRLVIYTAMGVKKLPGARRGIFVSNGAQTDTLLNMIKSGGPLTEEFSWALSRWKYEPDKNRTPRISGMVIVASHPVSGYPRFDMSIIRSHRDEPERAEHLTFGYMHRAPGVGHLLSTYDGDGNPLPSFSRKAPLPVPLEGSDRDIADYYWSALNKDNRVALFVRGFSVDGTPRDPIIINGCGEPKW